MAIGNINNQSLTRRELYYYPGDTVVISNKYCVGWSWSNRIVTGTNQIFVGIEFPKIIHQSIKDIELTNSVYDAISFNGRLRFANGTVMGRYDFIKSEFLESAKLFDFTSMEYRSQIIIMYTFNQEIYYGSSMQKLVNDMILLVYAYNVGIKFI